MNTFIWAATISAFPLILAFCDRGQRLTGASWFELQPYMTASKKQSGRSQQKQWHPERNRRKRR